LTSVPAVNPAVRSIVISGQDLGSGTDITAVFLAGIRAIILAQNTTTVTVTAGPLPEGTPNNVTRTSGVLVQSFSRGNSTGTVQFSYIAGTVCIRNAHIPPPG
jgi:hypothetical protein